MAPAGAGARPLTTLSLSLWPAPSLTTFSPWPAPSSTKVLRSTGDVEASALADEAQGSARKARGGQKGSKEDQAATAIQRRRRGVQGRRMARQRFALVYQKKCVGRGTYLSPFIAPISPLNE